MLRNGSLPISLLRIPIYLFKSLLYLLVFPVYAIFISYLIYTIYDMVLEYFTHRKPAVQGKEQEAETPVLNEEDEQFLNKITSEGNQQPPNPSSEPTVILDNGEEKKGKDAQEALMDGADQIALPKSPPEGQEDKQLGADDKKPERRTYVSYLPKVPNLGWSAKKQDQKATASDLQTAIDAVKDGKDPVPEKKEDSHDKDQKEISSLLDNLNLSAMNNRIFSLSAESQKLTNDFTQVLKDIVNGVPTAYDDMDKLMHQNSQKLKEMYESMPPFVQTLVKTLPARLGPEVMAAINEKPPGVGAEQHFQQKRADNAYAATASTSGSKAPAAKGKKQQKKIPTVRKLVSEKGAVAGILRSIINFLKLRFPAFVGMTNVLLSLAVFLLMFVFWYCHKRGREVRLEKAKEKEALEEAEKVEKGEDLEESTVLVDDEDDDDDEADDGDEDEVEDEDAEMELHEKEAAQEAAQDAKENAPEDHLAAQDEKMAKEQFEREVESGEKIQQEHEGEKSKATA